MTTSQPALTSQQKSDAEKRQTIVAALLSRLALQYWRPDFSPSQVKLLIQDFLEDLAPYDTHQIADACKAYRSNGANRFFPTTGQLIAAIKADPLFQHRASHLPDFERLPEPVRGGPVRSVAEILRSHGYEKAAAKWDNPAPDQPAEPLENLAPSPNHERN